MFLDFDYRDPKEISAVSLRLDSPLEPIVGYAKGISGTLRFDPQHPERSSGRIAVDVGSVQFAHDGYTATARGYALNEKKWPQIILAVRKVESVRAVGNGRYEGVVLANFTCRGITQPKRLAVSATYLPGRAEERTNGQHRGDLLVLRTKFDVSRKAHGISDGIPDSMVGDRIEVGVAVVGIHYASPAPQTEIVAPATPAPSPSESAPKELPRLGGGRPLSLDAIQGNRRLVVLFLNEQCGVTVYYKARLQKLVRDFGPKGFAFVAVRTGQKQFPDRPVDLPERAYLNIPFLDDASGALMRRYGIGQSLTFVVLDRGGRLRYQGGMDDAVDEKSVRKTPLRDALRDLAAGRAVRSPRAGAIGCAILPVER